MEAQKCLLNISDITDIAQKDIVEFFFRFKFLGKRLVVSEPGICRASNLDHFPADLDPYTLRRLERVEQ